LIEGLSIIIYYGPTALKSQTQISQTTCIGSLCGKWEMMDFGFLLQDSCTHSTEDNNKNNRRS